MDEWARFSVYGRSPSNPFKSALVSCAFAANLKGAAASSGSDEGAHLLHQCFGKKRPLPQTKASMTMFWKRWTCPSQYGENCTSSATCDARAICCTAMIP